MPRIARNAAFVSNYNHVTCRGNDKANIFRDPDDRRKYLAIVLAAKTKFHFQLFHYVLMDNHIHLSMEIDTSEQFSKCMGWLNRAYTMHYKRKYGHTGRLWEERPYHKPIKTESHALATGAYIELNPVRAGMVQKPADWQWSSYAYYAFGDSNQLITPNPMYLEIGNDDLARQKAYRAWVSMSQALGKHPDEDKNE